MFFKKESTRIAQHPILQPILKAINSLSLQQKRLEQEKTGKASTSLTNKKYNILTNILIHINEAIRIFNELPLLSINTKQEIGFLLVDLLGAFQQLKKTDFDILTTPRNNKKANVNNSVHYSLVGTGVLLGTALAGPTGGFGSGLGTGVLSYLFRNYFELNENTTCSFKVTIDLANKIYNLFNDKYSILQHNFSNIDIQFINETPNFENLSFNSILVYLDNGSIFYTFKTENGLRKLNLEPHLDRKLNFFKNDAQYNDINSLIFEEYLNCPEKNSTLEINFDLLNASQITLIKSIIFKQLIQPKEQDCIKNHY